ncbi:MAG: hypothetical protein QW589_04200 [Candidatus Bathyarchaeia archaeon]
MKNFFGIELLRRYGLVGKIKVFSWREYRKREGSDVGFVIEEGLKIKQLIQVTYGSSKEEIKKEKLRLC